VLNAYNFLNLFSENGVKYATGVPDSLLKDVCNEMDTVFKGDRHITAVNEGSAVALAMGHYLGSGEFPLVYMQNSGLGNAINPLLSLCDQMVYGIPMVLLIGWRGEIQRNGKQLKDEPQHKKQGLITTVLLDAMEIPYIVIDSEYQIKSGLVEAIVDKAKSSSQPVAILVRKNTFAPEKKEKLATLSCYPFREEIICSVLEAVEKNAIIVGTTGYTSREIFEYRAGKEQATDADFLTVGGMGHANLIAAAIAKINPTLNVVCIDGDGACLMHTGGLTESSKAANLIHILINNGVHDSVGKQRHNGSLCSFSDIALAMGYKTCKKIEALDELTNSLLHLDADQGPFFFEVMSRPGARSDLGRPTSSPKENKNAFMFKLSK
jgi:phosphonopyruvate decarboxylase